MTKIEWTQRTWNPIVSGCSIISEGCSNCYAMKMAHRLEAMGQTKYQGTTRKTQGDRVVWTGKVKIDMDDKALFEPLKRKKPTTYFVNSMTDLFHEDVPFEAIDKIIDVIAQSPQHTFQILTKRPENMLNYFKHLGQKIKEAGYDSIPSTSDDPLDYVDVLHNLWLGVSVENQEQAYNRAPYLVQTPAYFKFFSCEPLLTEVKLPLYGIDWVIVGGESGHNARPMHPDWVRSILNQCKNAGVPFFFKQWGEYISLDEFKERVGEFENKTLKAVNLFSECPMVKVGKKAAGNLLDGQTYLEYPTV